MGRQRMSMDQQSGRQEHQGRHTQNGQLKWHKDSPPVSHGLCASKMMLLTLLYVLLPFSLFNYYIFAFWLFSLSKRSNFVYYFSEVFFLYLKICYCVLLNLFFIIIQKEKKSFVEYLVFFFFHFVLFIFLSSLTFTY